MNRTTVVGILVLLSGIALYLIFSDEIPGIVRALIIGLTIGSAMVLKQEFERK